MCMRAGGHCACVVRWWRRRVCPCDVRGVSAYKTSLGQMTAYKTRLAARRSNCVSFGSSASPPLPRVPRQQGSFSKIPPTSAASSSGSKQASGSGTTSVASNSISISSGAIAHFLVAFKKSRLARERALLSSAPPHRLRPRPPDASKPWHKCPHGCHAAPLPGRTATMTLKLTI